MPVPRGPRETLAHEYTYRRALSASEMLPAVGVAIGAGLAAFWVARAMLQRTPLVPRPDVVLENERDFRSGSQRR